MDMSRLGFKATDPDMWCRDMQFGMGAVYRHDSKLEMCEIGFHFCLQLKDVHWYYSFSKSRVFLVQHGAHVLSKYDKCVTDEIVFLREITGESIQDLMTAPEYQKLMSENTDGLLMLFAARGDVETVRYLLEHGADIHAKDVLALILASGNGHRDVVELLLDRGADIHADKDTALRCASKKGHRDVVELLLDRGADIHAKDSWALRFASVNGHRDVVELLLDRGADIHADNNGALTWASEKGHRDVVELLLDRGADIHAQDDYALRWASISGHRDVVELLLKNGAENGAENRC